MPGSGWSSPEEINAGMARMITNQQGVMTTFKTGHLYRSTDSGASWKSYPIPVFDSGWRTVFDKVYHQETGRIRFVDSYAGVFTLDGNYLGKPAN